MQKTASICSQCGHCGVHYFFGFKVRFLQLWDVCRYFCSRKFREVCWAQDRYRLCHNERHINGMPSCGWRSRPHSWPESDFERIQRDFKPYLKGDLQGYQGHSIFSSITQQAAVRGSDPPKSAASHTAANTKSNASSNTTKPCLQFNLWV